MAAGGQLLRESEQMTRGTERTRRGIFLNVVLQGDAILLAYRIVDVGDALIDRRDGIRTLYRGVAPGRDRVINRGLQGCSRQARRVKGSGGYARNQVLAVRQFGLEETEGCGIDLARRKTGVARSDVACFWIGRRT